MARSGMKKTGVFFRNVVCSCGKHFRATPRMADTLMKLHMKVAHGQDEPTGVVIEGAETYATSNRNNPTFLKPIK